MQVRYNGTSAVRVSWQPPPANKVTGVISGYYVYCLGNTTSQHRNKTTKKDDLTVRVTGLLVGKVYRVEVASFTTAGRGPLSSPKTIYIMAGIYQTLPVYLYMLLHGHGTSSLTKVTSNVVR